MDNKGKLLVTVFAICSCSRDSFVTGDKPGLAHLHAIKFLHLDKFLAPRQLLSRHCASANLQTLCTETIYRPLIKIVPRHAYNSQNLYPDGKKCAIPSLHRDSFSAKVPGHKPALASGNSHRRILAPRYSDIKCRNLTLGPPYCRAVSGQP
jgi:hypothetical protein